MSGMLPKGYMVTTVQDSCAECAECTDSLLCKEVQCNFLCRHMYACSCYDFQNGHLCKHVHRIHSIIRRTLSPESDESDDSAGMQNNDEVNKDDTAAVTIATEGIQPNQHKTGFDDNIATIVMLHLCHPNFTLMISCIQRQASMC